MSKLIEMSRQPAPAAEPHDELDIPESPALTEIMCATNELSHRLGKWAGANGDPERMLLLIIGALTRSHEELLLSSKGGKLYYKSARPNRFGPSLVEAFMLICDLCYERDVDLESLVRSSHRHRLAQLKAPQRRIQAKARPETKPAG